ncbi:MAG TPA: RNA methyltransferase [Saprospiraceae bacterium]|nr:RNA methyltransferase [Saprospiraceae bacterium]
MDQLKRPELETYKSSDKIPVVVVLDNVRSGLNVGAIFRTCDAFSIESIYLCGITVQPPHAEILKTALGSTESVKWNFHKNTITALDELQKKGYSILPVEQTDKSLLLDHIVLTEFFPLALIFGNEMRGISEEVLLRCEQSLEIPQDGIKHSLNVATTAGIVLWECYRQFRLRFLSSAL